ncbi:motility associated factor glycosyltransferase family protein [Clostridium tyrobutyricum]|uniref:motility associated factor glycosyltransferase family protein n=1 Tax=Clostridium tyrobutyricum TaxID=1519 RepID=UPI001C392F2B|nr:6-hydroxymethylpterin diphosphokinase MptE-like protein [Clostridium tyrobutyricum]MBV4428326.1 DUF115 domain-containing protein [Clostridium tyrobutyricum]MBV4443316.1 DUF115 domain-containing protein [Clostridium tyrobutyricum]
MDENIFKQNLDILKNLSKQNIVSDDYYNIEDTVDKKYTFKYDNNEKKIYINSKYSVQNEVNKLFENIDFTKNNLFIVYGIGLGYHITELINRSSENSRIFVIEKDMKILNTYLRCKSLTELASKKITLFFGNEQQIISLLSYYLFKFPIMNISKNCTPVVLSSYYSIYGEWIANMNKRVYDLIRHAFFGLGNDVQDTIEGLKNNFKNIEELIKSPSIENIKNKYSGKPAIIVGAGPSLDKNIDELKKVQDKALILATDAVISTLKNHNIVPDAIFTIERVITTYNSFYKNNHIDKNIVFVGPPVVRNEILEKLQSNKKLLCLKKGESINEWINNSILKENRLINMGTSCAHIALAFAKYVDADPVVFIGMDLAYTKEGKTHSNDVEIGSKANLEDKSLIYVKDIYGDMIPTNYPLKNFLTFLETELARDFGNRKYIDATEGGAFKAGSEIMSLKEVISKYCSNDIERLYDMVPESRELDEIKYRRAIAELENLQNRFKKLREKCIIQIKKLENSLYNKHNLKETFNMLNKKDDIEKLIYKDAVIRIFVQGIYVTEKIKENSIGNIVNEENIRKRLKIRIELMAFVHGACNEVCKSIDNILANKISLSEGN